jgi:hydroxymethylpyrimidine pyrophosphatase-like HAD family hydrolase
VNFPFLTRRKAVLNVLSTFPATAFSATQALTFCVELIPAQYNKGTALLSLLEHLNASRPPADQIPLSQVIAFGDGGNDVAMLEVAGMSVAMGNAMPSAAAVAKWRTATNDEGGVGLFLEKIFFPSQSS